MADKLLMQEEIDALLSLNQDAAGTSAGELAGAAFASGSPGPEPLSDKEADALGEIGNISMGSAATSLSEILNQKVTITSPRVRIGLVGELFESLVDPYVLIVVRYTEGLQGYSLLLIKSNDMAVVSDLMMGGDGQNPPARLGELELSAGAEAMNQMMGAAATAMANIFGRKVLIKPPEVIVLNEGERSAPAELGLEQAVGIVSFRLTIGELLDSEFFLVKGIETVKEEVALLWHAVTPEVKKAPEPEVRKERKAPSPPVKPAEYELPATAAMAFERPALPAGVDQRKLDLILDIPLKVTVVLGRTRRSIKDILALGPGNIVELATLADEPVEVLVNGTLVARGEVVVVNENFGVQITSIITPQERLQHLGSKS